MKRTIICSLVVSVVTSLATQITKAQGTTYLSNLGQTSIGSDTVGNDSWLATDFFTGNNASGYLLNSVQLGMTDATGSPSGFAVMIYSASFGAGISPGSSLGSLSGSSNPSTAGIYTYSTVSSITLLPNRDYFIVITAETTVVNGIYEWGYVGANSYNGNSGWTSRGGSFFISSNGLNWHSGTSVGPEYAITATAIPEPAAWSLMLLGGGILICVRGRKPHAVTPARK
jgi:hypothetical protein